MKIINIKLINILNLQKNNASTQTEKTQVVKQ
jgi:hypothetical protein